MPPPLDIFFFAGGPFAVPILRALAGSPDVRLLGLVTNPDAPAGRRNVLVPCPAKAAAEAAGIPVFLPPVPQGAKKPNVNDASFVARLAAHRPDLFVVVDYGHFLGGALLDVPRLGSVNVHPSLLPRWRGAAPIQRAIAAGETTTGVSVLYVTRGMDAGDILSQAPAPILPDDTAATLAPRLAEQGARQLLDVVARFRQSPPLPPATPQDPGAVTFANALDKSEAAVDWSLPATVLFNRWRGFYPWPGALAALPDGTPFKLHALRVVPLPAPAAPGTVFDASPDGPVVACGDSTALCLLSVQPAGKPVMPGPTLFHGRRLHPGDILQSLTPKT